MSIKRPDLYEHNNPNNAIVDSDGVRGGRRVVQNLTDLYTLGVKSDQLKQHVTTVTVVEENKVYRLVDITKVNLPEGWTIEGGYSEGNQPDVITSNTLIVYPNQLNIDKMYVNPNIKNIGYKLVITGGASLVEGQHYINLLEDGGFQLINGVSLDPEDYLTLILSSTFVIPPPNPGGKLIDSLPSVLPLSVTM